MKKNTGKRIGRIIEIALMVTFLVFINQSPILAQGPQFSGYLEPKPYKGPIPTGPGVLHFDNPDHAQGLKPKIIESQKSEKKASGMRRLTPDEAKEVIKRLGINNPVSSAREQKVRKGIDMSVKPPDTYGFGTPVRPEELSH
jgi:hypothetical protein